MINETASELISKGIAPWTLDTPYDYQLLQMKLQLAKEDAFCEAAKKLKGCEKVLIVCDRGMLDNKAYMTDGEFMRAILHFGKNEKQLTAEYFAVYHMESAAKSAFSYYTTKNNSSRTETPDEAVLLDDKTILAWKNHPRHFIIKSRDDFNSKLNDLICKIEAVIDV